MAAQKFRIPELQTLPLSTFFKQHSDIRNHFPFSEERSCFYYLARNAIWHGVDILGLKPGDVVLMPSYHHGIEVEVLLNKGLELVYYRVDEQMRIDFDHMESLVKPHTKVLYAIHYIGFPQSVERLSEIAEKYNLKFIEDCALSLFSASPEGPVGRAGDIGIFCLYKTLPIPHGGMLVVNNPELTLPPIPDNPDLNSTITILANRLIDNFDTKWGGLGFRITSTVKSVARKLKSTIPVEHVPIDTEELVEEHLNLGVSPITRYLINRMSKDDIVKKRRENYICLVELLQNHISIPFKELPDGVCPLFLPIYVESKLDTHLKLHQKGIESVNFWSRNHRDVPAGRFPEVTSLREHILELPIHQGLDQIHIEYIASIVKEIT